MAARSPSPASMPLQRMGTCRCARPRAARRPTSLIVGEAAADWAAAPAETKIGVFAGLVPELGEVFAAAAVAERKLYGFAHHEMSSSFVGSSAGLRLRHDQPTGKSRSTPRPMTCPVRRG
jgi:hypothetical protein